MARCPKLDFESGGFLTTSDDRFICTISGEKMYTDDSKVKYFCKTESGEQYRDCPLYKNY